MSDCGFSLRVNNQWVPLTGVQAGVPIRTDRPGSSWLSTGGFRHVQAAAHAPRTWELDFGNATPEAVAALTVAAQGAGGDVWIWDEQAARQNLLPADVHGRAGYPIVDCGGVPLASITAGPGVLSASRTVDVPISANLTVTDYPFVDSAPRITVNPADPHDSQRDALIRVSVPPTPDGHVLVGAELVLTYDGIGSPTSELVVHSISNAWSELDSMLDFNAIPPQALVGSGMLTDRKVAVDLGDLTGSVGSDVSYRLSAGSPSVNMVFGSRASSFPPVVRFSYALLARDLVTRFRLRDVPTFLSLWGDFNSTDQLGEFSLDGGNTWGPLSPTGADGVLRRHVLPIPSLGDLDIIARLFDTTDYLLAGLMWSTLPPDSYHPPQKAACRVRVNDPTLTLDELYAGSQGRGRRTVTIEEVL